MLFLTVEDRTGGIECVVFPKGAARFSSDVEENKAVVIEGRLSSRDGEDEIKLLVDNANKAAKIAQFQFMALEKAESASQTVSNDKVHDSDI